MIELKSLLSVLNKSFGVCVICENVPIEYYPDWNVEDIYFWSPVKYEVNNLHFDPEEFTWVITVKPM